jgi:hypothetical protein
LSAAHLKKVGGFLVECANLILVGNVDDAEDSMGVEFPNLGDKAFGLDGSIVIDLRFMRDMWRGDSETSYIEGFHESAGVVAERLKSDWRTKANGRMFIGLAYLYRHCIELQLKFIIRYAIKCKVISVSEKQIFHHKLGELWEIVRQILTDNPAGPLEQLDFVEAVLMELHQVDPGGEDFRFSRRGDKTRSMRDVPDTFSLDQFVESMEKIYTFLDCVESMFMDWYDALMANVDHY